MENKAGKLTTIALRNDAKDGNASHVLNGDGVKAVFDVERVKSNFYV